MSLVPAFEIGIWNAWILVLIYLFINVVPLALLNLSYKGVFKKSASAPTAEKFERLSVLVLVLASIYSIFLPLKLWTMWFYIGGPVFLLGLIVFAIASVNFGTTPVDELVTKGLYHYSRHPMYLAIFLVLIGISIASASSIFLLVSIIELVSIKLAAPIEERFCIDKYGNAYREYMNRTPRWIGIPKSSQSD